MPSGTSRSRSVDGLHARERLADALVADVHSGPPAPGRSSCATTSSVGSRTRRDGVPARRRSPRAPSRRRAAHLLGVLANGGEADAAWPASGMSSKPTTDIDSGTRRPAPLERVEQRDRDHVVGAADGGGPSTCPPRAGRERRAPTAAPRAGGRPPPRARGRVREGDAPVAERGQVLDDLPPSRRTRRRRRCPGAGRGPRTRRRRPGCRGRAARRGWPTPRSRRGRSPRPPAGRRAPAPGRPRCRDRSRSRHDAPRSRRGERAARPGRAIVAWNGFSASGMTTPRVCVDAALERPGDLVLAVAELVDRRRAPGAGCLGDGRGVVQDVRDGGDRHSGAAGDVVHRRAHAAASTRKRRPAAAPRATSRCPPRRRRGGPRARSRRRRRSRLARRAATSAAQRVDVVAGADGGEVPGGRPGSTGKRKSRSPFRRTRSGWTSVSLPCANPIAVADLLDHAHGVDPLPPEVAGVEVHAHVRAGGSRRSAANEAGL